MAGLDGMNPLQYFIFRFVALYIIVKFVKK